MLPKREERTPTGESFLDALLIISEEHLLLDEHAVCELIELFAEIPGMHLPIIIQLFAAGIGDLQTVVRSHLLLVHNRVIEHLCFPEFRIEDHRGGQGAKHDTEFDFHFKVLSAHYGHYIARIIVNLYAQ